MQDSLDRRKFIKMTGAAGLGLGVMGSPFSVLGSPSANDRLTVAVLGTNSRGRSLARGFAAHPNSEVAYICDVDEEAIKKGQEAVKESGQTKVPEGMQDFRRALEDPSLDAVAMALPIHWHTPASILALQAGKHVYVEKPCSYNPHEGELLVQAADKYKRVVQMGNQRRSWPNVTKGLQLLKEGVIGHTYFARCWYGTSRGSIGYGKPAPVPSNLDYDLWQGPAPRKEYRDNVVHYNWHWLWHWGGGELLNNGIHFLDLARLGLGVTYPSMVTSSGGRYHWQDDQETPDTQVVTYQYPEEKTVLWEARSCNPRPIEGSATGVSFHGRKGTMVIDGNRFIVYDNDNEEVMNSDSDSGTSAPDLNMVHFDNFIEAIRNSRRPVSDISDANISVHNCHLGNIAYRTRRAIHCDTHNGHIVGDTGAMRYWSREYEPGWQPVV